MSVKLISDYHLSYVIIFVQILFEYQIKATNTTSGVLFVPVSTGIKVRNTKPVPTISSDSQFHSNHNGNEYRIVCYYYAVDAWYRTERGFFIPEDIDPLLCTHLHYAYGFINPATLSLEPEDKWAEIDNKFYERVMSLKEINPKLKVILAVGGWTDNTSSKFSAMVTQQTDRRTFIDNAIPFLELHGFDGLDIAWFFPVCWHGECSFDIRYHHFLSDHQSDLLNFGSFLREIKSAFDQRESPLLLSATVSGDTMIARRCYDFAALALLDYINVMAFDYVAHWNHITGHQAPIYQQPGTPPENNVNATINLYLRKGIPRWKLLVGIPAFGRTFTLTNPESHEPQSAAEGPGIKGKFTRAEGLLAFYEICDLVGRDGWRMEKDNESNFYAFSGDQWVSFDHPLTALTKAEYVSAHQLGGIMIWDIDRDDFLGTCFGKKFPLLTAINSILVDNVFDHDPRDFSNSSP